MTRATVLQEVRQMRFEELYKRRQRRELTIGGCGGYVRRDGTDVSPLEWPL